LRFDSALGLMSDTLRPRREDPAPGKPVVATLAGKSTLNRLDPLHGAQEGRFFHGYYRSYCYLPLYIFDGRHLLVAKLRPANIDASAGAKEEIARVVAYLRQAWPEVEVWLRADSGFARDALMGWCEENRVDYVFGSPATSVWSQ
jgi:Transposase DDE domain group 1